MLASSTISTERKEYLLHLAKCNNDNIYSMKLEFRSINTRGHVTLYLKYSFGFFSTNSEPFRISFKQWMTNTWLRNEKSIEV